MSADLHGLTGAYALDALDDDEQTSFEEHVGQCETCRAEVAEMQATMGRIGDLLEEAPPAGLRDHVLSEIGRTPQERRSDAPADAGDRDPAPVPPAGRRASRPCVNGLLATAAAVVVILAVGVSLLVANLNERITELEAASSDMAEMLAAPDAQAVTVEGPGGTFARIVMSVSRGEAMFLADGMDPAPHEHTYELWLIDDEGARSVGLFDVDDTGRVTQLLRGDMERAAAIGVTVEPEGGSPEPTTDPVMLIELEEA